MKLIIAVVATISILIGLGYRKFDELTRPLPLPDFDTNIYWGPGDVAKYKADTTIKPYTVKREAAEIEDLRKQLNRTLKLEEPLEGIKFEYGFNTAALEQFVIFWRDDYLPRWEAREKYLNTFPQYTTEIQGLRIHFIHAKPSAEAAAKKKVIPLLLLHGWPGSVREFYDFIPILTEPSELHPYVYEVIAPSLVGYGWSQAAAKPGFDAAQMAIVMRNLMLRLGHEKFLIQGGDWGSIIGNYLSTIFPANVLGYHSNMCMLRTPLAMMKWFWASFNPEKYIPTRFHYEHHFPISEKLQMLIEETGYFHIQATKPDTIGAVLSHNPVGLAAYIIEKFQLVTGPGLNQQFNAMSKTYGLDAVIDNVMIYYLSNCATSAGRFYAENMTKRFLALNLDRVQSLVPMGCARFKNDLPAAFNWQLQDKFPNLVHSMYFNQGGHFAAMEVPVMLAIDFHTFTEKLNLE